MPKGFHWAISAARSCSCPARIIALDTAKRAKGFTKKFSPNAGIYIRYLGPDILLRSMAIAYRGAKTVVASPKVRKAPGSFSQSVRVGDWLLLAGQDAVGFNREVEAEGALA